MASPSGTPGFDGGDIGAASQPRPDQWPKHALEHDEDRDAKRAKLDGDAGGSVPTLSSSQPPSHIPIAHSIHDDDAEGEAEVESDDDHDHETAVPSSRATPDKDKAKKGEKKKRVRTEKDRERDRERRRERDRARRARVR